MRTSVPSTHMLPGGRRVRLRLPQPGDRPALEELVARSSGPGGPPDLDALLHFDPRRRTVLCAGSFIGGGRMIVGVVAIDRIPGARPDVVVGDERLAAGITALLTEVLADDTAARERFAA